MSPTDLRSLAELGSLLLRLGLAVYEAVQSGDTSRTVGEIFAGVPKDQAEIDRLESLARARFGEP